MLEEAAKRTTNYDVLIVGAGPAGAAAARELVKNGYSVAIVEKKRLPRYKICSGLILDRAQDLLAEHFDTPPEGVFCNPAFLKGIRLCAQGDLLTDLPLSKARVYNVWRSAFDHWLVQQSGADVLEAHELIGFKQTGSTVKADILGHGEEPLQIEASYLIGADGGRSRVRNLLDPVFEKRIHWHTFAQLYCTGTINLDSEFYYMFFDPSLSSFYTWLHFKDECLVYGVGTQAGKAVTPYLEDSTEYLTKYFGLKVENVERRTGCVVSDMPVNGNFLLGHGRVLLAGEAAGFMNVFGEGISSALATGQIAGSAVSQAGVSGQAVLPVYEELVKVERQLTVKSWKLAEGLSIARKGEDANTGR